MSRNVIRLAPPVAVLLLLGLLLRDSGFPRRETEPPPRRLGTLERMALPRLRAVQADVARLAARRRNLPPQPGLTDYRVIFHAHAEDSVHTAGTRPEMLAGARPAGVNAIFLSDHFRPPRDFMDSWRGLHDGVLFIPGSEWRGCLIHPPHSVMSQMEAPLDELLGKVRDDGGLAFLSHIEERPDHPMDQLDGLEIYNRHYDAKREPATLLGLALRLTSPAGLAELQEAVKLFPGELYAAGMDYPTDYLAKWDRELAFRPLTGVAANDAHHNQVFTLTKLDDSTVSLGTVVDPPEKRQRFNSLTRPGLNELTRGLTNGAEIARLDFDPYPVAFRAVCTHVLAPELTEPALRDAVRAGRVYVSHDWMGDATGFQFVATRSGGVTGQMGEAVEAGSVRLEARLPLPCSRIRLLRDGRQVALGNGYELTHHARQPGAYRVEGWLLLDGEERIWVLSNPLYVR
ncbi:MAG: histidinol phosphatase [Limisphaerales bacterium]